MPDVTIYLYVNQRGSVRMTKSRASTKGDEVRIPVTLSIPTEYFRRPEPAVRVTLPPPPETPAATAEVTGPAEADPAPEEEAADELTPILQRMEQEEQ